MSGCWKLIKKHYKIAERQQIPYLWLYSISSYKWLLFDKYGDFSGKMWKSKNGKSNWNSQFVSRINNNQQYCTQQKLNGYLKKNKLSIPAVQMDEIEGWLEKMG